MERKQIEVAEETAAQRVVREASWREVWEHLLRPTDEEIEEVTKGLSNADSPSLFNAPEVAITHAVCYDLSRRFIVA